MKIIVTSACARKIESGKSNIVTSACARKIESGKSNIENTKIVKMELFYEVYQIEKDRLNIITDLLLSDEVDYRVDG